MDDSMFYSNLEQNIEQSLSSLQDTWINWNDGQQQTKYRIVSSELVRDRSLLENIQKTTDTSRKDSQPTLKPLRKKTIKKRKPVTKENPPIENLRDEQVNELDMLQFVQQHKNEVKRFVLQNEQSNSSLWEQYLMELGARSKKKSKVPFPIFLGIQRKQKQRRARLLSKSGSAFRK